MTAERFTADRIELLSVALLCVAGVVRFCAVQKQPLRDRDPRLDQ
jgi:hypothetical protein